MNARQAAVAASHQLGGTRADVMLGPGDDADDVGQETFIRFHRALGTFRGEASVKSYLTRIAINLSLNALKRRRTHTFHLVDFMDPESGDTAMARTTGIPATIAARMKAGGRIAETGVRFPEEIFSGALGDRLLAELEGRGVRCEGLRRQLLRLSLRLRPPRTAHPLTRRSPAAECGSL
jgi:RNA polymerase sigma factor (sigma-70 family)